MKTKVLEAEEAAWEKQNTKHKMKSETEGCNNMGRGSLGRICM